MSLTRRHYLLAALGAAALPLQGAAVKGARYRVRRMARADSGAAARDTNVQQSRGGPLQFDLQAEERWPIRGVDPVLYVGGVAIEAYQFANAENTILRFTCYDASALQDGARVYVQYGQDGNSRTALPDFRWVDVAAQ